MRRRLTELFDLQSVQRTKGKLADVAVKHVDLRTLPAGFWQGATIRETYFLGCTFATTVAEELRRRGANIIGEFKGLPYQPFRGDLYSPDELLQLVSGGKTRDEAIYKDYLTKGRFSPDVVEAITRRLHDDAIDDGIERLFTRYDRLKCVGLMGRSSAPRTDLWYRIAAETSRALSRAGYLTVNGGGPGMMEAASLGAYLAPYPDDALEKALTILAKAPTPSSNAYVKQALEVKKQFPKGGQSLGIPTWFYGQEPTNILTSNIAKYFDNSIREGGLVQIGQAGVVFCPGSAGTRQEIFMDAAMNHYATTGFVSPMVFLGRSAYAVDTHIFQLVNEVANGQYKDMIFIADNSTEVVTILKDHPPRQIQPPRLR